MKPNGKLNDDALDISLMMLYAHIMYTSESYDLALEYMFRCHALDEHNPMVCLSISLTFFHLILNRRIEDQARYLLQGMTFLLKYYDSRKYSPNVEERQEAHYNVARAYHMLGLTGQALPYYILVLEETETAEGLGVVLRQELVVDAAYNLQTIYSTVGNLELTKAITERWLVL
jgi:general transcription factor 3C polypeptide 3 (transcription factor C subunit 4)